MNNHVTAKHTPQMFVSESVVTGAMHWAELGDAGVSYAAIFLQQTMSSVLQRP